MIFRWELGKHFLGVAEDDELSLEQPRRRQLRAYWGYDAGAKLYTCAAFFFGGGRYIGTSPGWRGDVLTFAGEMFAGGERHRDAEGLPPQERHRPRPSASTSSGPTAIARAASKKPAPARATTEASASATGGERPVQEREAIVSRSRCSCSRSLPVGSLAAKSSASKTWRISTSSPAVNGARLIHSTTSALVFVCSSQ